MLHGRLAPLDNIGPEQLTIDALLRRVQQGGVQEVIMATNPTLEGDGTALYISNLLADRRADHPVGTRFAFRIGAGVRQQPDAGGRPGRRRAF